MPTRTSSAAKKKSPAKSANVGPRTLEEMIAACRFFHVNDEITDQGSFPLIATPADVSRMMLARQDENGFLISEDGAAINPHEWRSATLADLLAYAEKKWRGGHDRVIALDPNARPLGRFPCLFDWPPSGLHLGLTKWDGGPDRLLLIRKSSPTDSAESSVTPPGTLAALIAACRFTSVEDYIKARRFHPARPTAKLSDIRTLCRKDLGGTDVTSFHVTSHIDKIGCRSATFEELLVWSAKKWNGRDYVVSLDSVGLKYERVVVPYVCGEDADDRQLSTTHGETWGENTLFLIVPK